MQDRPQAEQADGHEPEQHDWPEQAADALGAAALDCEEGHNYHECRRHDCAMHRRVDDRESFDRAEH